MVVCFIAGEVLKTRLQNQAGTALGIVAHNAGNLLQQDLQQQIRRAQVLASSPELWEQGLDSHSISQLLQRMQHLNPYNVWIGVTDIDGQVQNATGGLLQGTNVSERPWFQEALRGPTSVTCTRPSCYRTCCRAVQPGSPCGWWTSSPPSTSPTVASAWG